MRNDNEVARTIPRSSAQLDLGLDAGAYIDHEDQAKGRPSWVVRRNPNTGERQLEKFIWGLLPHRKKNPSTAPRPINARAETVSEHPMFAAAFRQRRAIVPADAYYQRRTRGGSGLFAISRKNGRPMAIAGLWEWFKQPNGDIIQTYCTITTVSNPLVAPIHHRMPIILEEEDWPVWLGEQPGNPAALLHAPPADVLQIHRVPGRAGRRHAADVAAQPTFAF